MKKEYREGLLVDNSVMIEDLSNSGLSLLARFFQLLAILIGSWSCLSIFLDCIPVPARVAAVHLTILLTFAVVCILCLIPSFTAVKLFFCILFYSLFFISRHKAIENGFYIMENEVIRGIEQYYDVSIGFYIADYRTEVADSTLLMVMITIPVVSLISIAVIKGRLVKITSVVMLLPVAACFLLGFTPPEHYMVSCIASILYLTRLGLSGSNVLAHEQKGKLHKIYSWTGAWLCIVCLLLFFIMKLFISEESYNGFTSIHNMRTNIQTKLSSITLEDITEGITNYRLLEFNSTKGGLDGGALGRTGKVEYDGSEQLRIITDIKSVWDGVYLKGFVGSNYTGDRWVGHTDEDAAEFKALLEELPEDYHPIHQMIELVYNGWNANLINDLRRRHMEVEYVGANKRFLYSPYITDFSLMDNINYKQDLYTTPGRRQSSYSYEYYDFIDMIRQEDTIRLLTAIYYSALYDEYFEYEKLYRNFVEKAYTRLPEEGLEQLRNFCGRVMEEQRFSGTGEKIAYVKDYLRSNTSYSLTPGKVPPGKDYVEYFLFENKVGYCSHYASAAVLMLRVFGVPARYVEGYTVSPSDIAINSMGELSLLMNENNLNGEIEISIKDYNAHAWVEVYFDGIGWIPIDFTPSSGIGYNAYSRQTLSQPTVTLPPPGEATPTPLAENTEDNTDDNKDNKENEITQKPEAEKTADTASNSSASGSGPQSAQNVTVSRIAVILLVLSVILCLAAIYNIRRYCRLMRASNNNKAIYLFARLERILNFLAGSSFKKRIELEDNEDYLRKSFDFVDELALERFMNTVRKARYGRCGITGSELRQVKSFYNSFVKKICSDMPFARKVLLKLILLVN